VSVRARREALTLRFSIAYLRLLGSPARVVGDLSIYIFPRFLGVAQANCHNRQALLQHPSGFTGGRNVVLFPPRLSEHP
jgi:hypothetical protein